MRTETSSSHVLSRIKWRTILRWISVLVAVQIALHSLIVKEPVVTMVGAALWLGGSFWTRRGTRGGPVLIGVLATWEVLATLLLSDAFAEGAHVAAWILVAHFVSVVIALVAAVQAIREGAPSHARALPS